MRLRQLGRSNVHLSAVGFGTCQLRLVPRNQAIETLMRGFELGVNWVHTSPDYAGAEDIVAEAIRRTSRDVIPVTDGSGDMEHFAASFERACELFGRNSLPLWGISCIDDQEFVGRNVWEKGGMVEFLNRMKSSGRLGAIYCTTHGPPDYIEGLIRSRTFDGIMLAYNPLGFHVLSSNATAEGKVYENIPENGGRLFRLAEEEGVGLLVMKALAGGLLGRSRAIPPVDVLTPEREEVRAEHVLRYILGRSRAVVSVVPGTCSLEEAEENARAGTEPVELPASTCLEIEERVARMHKTLCSRCGECEPSCSQGLPISWQFRDAYMWLNPGDCFEAVPRLHYFHLHPAITLACHSCTDPSCTCHQGLDIPLELNRVHELMLGLLDEGKLPLTPAQERDACVGDEPCARVVYALAPAAVGVGDSSLCRLWLENAGERLWSHELGQIDHLHLEISDGDGGVQTVELREDVHPLERSFLTFELEPFDSVGERELSFELVRSGGGGRTELLRQRLNAVAGGPA